MMELKEALFYTFMAFLAYGIIYLGLDFLCHFLEKTRFPARFRRQNDKDDWLHDKKHKWANNVLEDKL